jgi:hypothetical protein
LLLLHQNYRRKTQISRAEFTEKNCFVTWTIPCVIMGARSKSISPEKRWQEPPIQFIPQICHRVTSNSSVMPKCN